MSVLRVNELKKSYRKGFIPRRVEVLKGVTFSVGSGTITGFLGGNGAGKTTTMKCLLGLSFPDSGQVEFFGGQALDSSVRQRIGFLPEHPYFYEYLTGREFLRFYGQLTLNWSARKLADRIDDLLRKVDLLDAKDKRIRDYSKGMLQKIGLAQAIIHEPELVILDEPMSGLDPDGRLYVSEIIIEIARSGAAVFFSSHLLPDAEKLCRDLVILRGGRVVYSGTTEALLERMGQKAVIYFVQDGMKSQTVVPNHEQLQIELDRLRARRATITEIRPERNLEQAFTLVGLRGVET